jgi:hypothetical protein
MSLDGLDSPRLDEKGSRFRHWGSGSPRDSVTDWIVQGSTRKTAGLDTGAVAAPRTVSADSAAVSASAALF